MQLIPNSNREDNAPTHFLRLREFNQCHNPKGAGGGQFCSSPDQAYPRYPYSPSAEQRLLEGYPDKAVAAAVKSARTRLTKLTAETGHEYMAIMHADNSVHTFTSNEEKYVEFPDENYVDRLRENPPRFTAHTHPTDSAPSLPDIRSQVKTRDPKGLVFTPSGDWYEITVTDFNRADQVLGKGRRYATYWETGTRGAFANEFNRLKRVASRAAADETDAWIAKQTGWTVAKKPHSDQGFSRPRSASKREDGFLTSDGNWVSRNLIGDYIQASGVKGPTKDAIIAYHIARFGDHTPRIWMELAENHKDWLQFRYSRKRGPHANR